MSQNPVFQMLKGLKEYGDDHSERREGLMKTLLLYVFDHAYGDPNVPDNTMDFAHLFMTGIGKDIVNSLVAGIDFDPDALNEDAYADIEDQMCNNYSGEAHYNFESASTYETDMQILSGYGLDQAMNKHHHRAMDIVGYHKLFKRGDGSPFYGLMDALVSLIVGEYTHYFTQYLLEQLRLVMTNEERSHLVGLLVEGKTPLNGDDLTVGECEICSNTTEPCYTLPCKHAFGLQCLSAWTKKQCDENHPNTCPMCRAPY